MKLIESQLQKNMTGTMDLCFVLKGNNITFDEWKFNDNFLMTRVIIRPKR